LQVPALVRVLWNSSHALGLPALESERLELALSLLLLEQSGAGWASFRYTQFNIVFSNQQTGKMQFIGFGVWRGDAQGQIVFSWVTVAGDFALAPDYMIIDHTESDFLSSSTWSEIVFVGRSVTRTDIEELLLTALAIAKWTAELIE
jgi:hypothetical protein